MDANTIKDMGRKLKTFLAEFDDCFGRSDQRAHLQTYINGQLSDLERKSIEPIAIAADVPPRTLQYFLSNAPWDGPRLRNRLHWIVARDHSHPRAIGIIDESGNPKKGKHTWSHRTLATCNPAGIEMKSAGQWSDGNRQRLK